MIKPLKTIHNLVVSGVSFKTNFSDKTAFFRIAMFYKDVEHVKIYNFAEHVKAQKLILLNQK